MKRIRVDFNQMYADVLWGNSERAEEPLEVGERVLAYDVEGVEIEMLITRLMDASTPGRERMLVRLVRLVRLESETLEPDTEASSA